MGLEACSVQGFRVFRPRGSLCLSVSLSLSTYIYIYIYVYMKFSTQSDNMVELPKSSISVPFGFRVLFLQRRQAFRSAAVEAISMEALWGLFFVAEWIHFTLLGIVLPTIRPRGSKYPNSRVLGPKNHWEYGFWDLKPCYLGTWTLWETISVHFLGGL